MALHDDQLVIIMALLDLNCDMNEVEEVTQLYPIHIAAHKSSPECLDLLLEYNQTPGAGAGSLELNAQEETSFNTALCLAAREGHYDIVERLVAAGCDVDLSNAAGKTPLYMACVHGHADIVRLLLQNNACLDLARPSIHEPELVFSCLYNHNNGDVLRVCMEYGMDVNITSAEGRTPLMYALTWQQEAMLDVLLDPRWEGLIDLDIPAPDTRETALFAAIWGPNRSSKYVKALLKQGCNANHTNNAGVQPLDLAVKNNCAEVVEILLDHDAKIRVTSSRCLFPPPLVACAKCGHNTIAKLLIFYGADIDATSYELDSPLYVALQYRNLEMVQLLIESGCNISAESWLHHMKGTELPNIFIDQPQLQRRLQKLAESPQLLTTQCRRAVRRHLIRHRLSLYSILDLRQPQAIKDFLMMRHR